MILKIRVIGNPAEVGVVQETEGAVSHDALKLRHVGFDKAFLEMHHGIERIQRGNRTSGNVTEIDTVVLNNRYRAVTFEPPAKELNRVWIGIDHI